MSSYNPKVVIDKPKRSNFDLSRIHRCSAAPGVLYPVLIEQVFPGDDISLDMSALVKTMPLLGPLMGTAKVQFDYFFVPVRLYQRQLHDDRVTFNPNLVEFPRFSVKSIAAEPTTGAVAGVHTQSLGNFLHIPERWANVVGTTVGAHRTFNAVPLLGYWDIYRGYYANTQIGSGVFIKQAHPNVKHDFSVFPLSNIDDMRKNILATDDGLRITELGSSQISGTNLENYGSHFWHYPMGGLAIRTYLPDKFQVWINSSRYNQTNTSAVVDVVSNKFNMDQLRFASKLNRMLQKTLVSGGRYSDWQEVQYGVRLRGLNEVPTFIGSSSLELQFEDVVQLAPTEGDPLGTLGGRGVGFMANRKHRYYVPENGFIMCIMSIVPRIDYYTYLPHFYNQITLGDVHVPELDGIGFQDLLIDTICPHGTSLQSSWPHGNQNKTSVGKQPAFTEIMSAVNTVHGDFANRNKLMHLVFAFDPSVTATTNDINTYVNPSYFNQNFADSRKGAQNFWIQTRFGFHVKRVMSKRLMPSL